VGINDGSTDATAAIAERMDVFIISLPYNLGIGAAIQTGYMFARDTGYDIAVQVDGECGLDTGVSVGRVGLECAKDRIEAIFTQFSPTLLF